MKRKRILALIMVLAFVMTFMVTTTSAAPATKQLKCLHSHSGIHVVDVHYDDAALQASDISISWDDNDDEIIEPEQYSEWTRWRVFGGWPAAPTPSQGYELSDINEYWPFREYVFVLIEPNPPHVGIFTVDVDDSNISAGYQIQSITLDGTPVSVPFQIESPCYDGTGAITWNVNVNLNVLATFVSGDGTQTQWVAQGGTPTPPAISDPLFIGWNPAVTSITAPQTFTATYADPLFTVSYDGNGNDSGTVPVDADYTAGTIVNVDDGSGIGLSHHDFEGWHDGTQIVSGTFTMPSDNVTLTAQWDEHDKFDITYNLDGKGTTPDQTVFNDVYDQETTPAAPVVTGNAGWEFTGWLPSIAATVTESAVYVAQYTGTFTVTYDVGSNGTTGDQVFFNEIEPGTTTPAAPVVTGNAGWEFTGWLPSIEVTVTESAVYVAQYTGAYTVTFDIGSNGTTGDTVFYDEIEPGTAMPAVPDVTPNYGWLYLGWDSEIAETVDGNLVYTALYEEVNDSLNVEKTALVETGQIIEIGETVNYEVTVTNDGNVPIFNIVLVDEDSGFTSEPFDLEVDENKTFTGVISYQIKEADSFNGTYTNTATATGQSDELETLTTASDSATVTVASPNPSIVLTKTAGFDGELPLIDDLINYSFMVTNNGTVTVFDIIVSDTMLGYNSEPFTLAPGESYTLTDVSSYVVTEVDAFAGIITNIASAMGTTNPEIDETNTLVSSEDETTVDVELAVPSISIEKTADVTGLYVNGTINYIITVTNDGNVTLYQGIVEDSLLSLSESFDSLAPGMSVILNGSYTTSAADIPEVTNNAITSAFTFGGYASSGSGNDEQQGPGELQQQHSDSAEVTVTVLRQNAPVVPSINVTIVPDKTTVEAGNDVTFTVTVTNAGNAVLYNTGVSAEAIGLNQMIGNLFITGSWSGSFTVTLNDVGVFPVTVLASAGTVSDSDATSVQVTEPEDEEEQEEQIEIITPPSPTPPPLDVPENPQTGTVPFDAYAVSGLLAMGAGLFALIKRKKEDEE